MTANSFPEFITARRRELELTLGDVAASLGVSPITVSNWSNGDSKPKADNLVALAKLLEVPADKLAQMAAVTLKSAPEPAVNLMPPAPAGTEVDTDKPLTEETDPSEPIAELRVADPAAAADVVLAKTDESVGIPQVEPPTIDEPAVTDAIEADKDDDEEPAPELDTAGDRHPDEEDQESDPTPKRRPSLRRSRPAAAVAEREVTTLPLTYVEDPRQLMRYRIRWALTVIVLFVMFVVLLWATRELLSALSEVKQAVTPGGIGGG